MSPRRIIVGSAPPPSSGSVYQPPRADFYLLRRTNLKMTSYSIAPRVTPRRLGAPQGFDMTSIPGRGARMELIRPIPLDPEEEAFLKRLRAQIGLSDDVAAELEEEGRQRARTRFLSRASVRPGSMLADQGAVIELQGSSEDSFEEAVRAAIASTADVETTDSAELETLRVDLSEGRVRRWSVKLRTRR